MNPKLSIIVPVYNVEKFLGDCVKSILSQSFKEFELILVNDGSTDRSGVICDEYAKKDQRIQVHHKENGGQSSARNKGIDVAKGQYLGFIDSDDWIHNDMYNILFNKALEAKADIAACNIIQYNKDDTKYYFCNDSTECLFDRNSAMGELYLNHRLTFSPCNKIYKRSLFENIRFKEGYILEDIDFAYRIIHQSKKVFYTGEALYNYRYNDKSTMRKAFSKKRLDEFEVRKNLYLFYRENYPEHADEVYAEWFLTGLMLYVNIDKYYHDEKKQYKYLLEKDRKIIKELIFNKEYSKKKKLLLALGMISSPLLVKFYRYYWDKVKKEL
ncbi:glycosyltransferase [Bacillus sp. DNRA2]|uniref:glycosyltransferase n=1 Tax=Bacillus sp. DNRA2 TaxID=2723053 RepID=UPI00145F51B5|nr:glycosyltransferase [Bacillus sp. DNRA2]NMD68800.1 glycosyltransferase [Bacillus sp. DNRA2]